MQHRCILILSLCTVIMASCGGGTKSIRNVDLFADISSYKPLQFTTSQSADSTLKVYTTSFKVQNPLVSSGTSVRTVDPNHENDIYCMATLLDSLSTEADIARHCFSDSLDAAACESYREKYLTEQERPGMFRIRITMESGFSSKSMEPKLWSMYIENSRGIMIEPADIVVSPVTAQRDSIFSDFHRVYLPRRLLKRDITLYFNRKTFFGEDLLSSKNPFIVFVMTFEKRTLVRVGWKTSAFPGK
ncbi:hypothetical protein LLG96_03550 [bacterium]|nr:hypothetical protein [bacterium]